MSRADRSGEPAREATYRRLYERMRTQDGCITFLLVELRALQKRVTKLEQRNENLASAALKLARHSMGAVRELEQPTVFPPLPD